MYRSILLTNENADGDGYGVEWDGNVAVITHDVEADYIVGILNDNGDIVTIPYVAESGRLTLTFSSALSDIDVYRVNIISFNENQSESVYVIGDHYSGTVDNIMMFCKSLGVNGDELVNISPVKVENMQRLVDDAIDDTLGEYYFTPLVCYNQQRPDGTIRKVFPGKIRLMATQWVAGLLLQTEFQNVEPNINEQATRFVEASKRELQEIVDYSVRIPGQRRKHPSPTMPPNLAPSKTNEFRL